MENFEFKSQVATSIEQSKRLLELGLKKETADMCWQKTTLNGEVFTYPAQDVWHYSTAITNFHIPAWSLHRLLMMYGDNYSFFSLENAYSELIRSIAIDIEKGTFNQDYLEEK